MRVVNIHERPLPVEAARVGLLLDSLSSSSDGLWPRGLWPPLKLNRAPETEDPTHNHSADASPERPSGAIPSGSSNRPAGRPALSVGAKGGHGPIRYFVQEYVPGERVRFQFTGPRGFDGFHEFEVVAQDSSTILRHTIRMHTRGIAQLTWPLIYRPLHDALIEDTLTTGQLSLDLEPEVHPWPFRVRLLRWILTRGKGRPQQFVKPPDNAARQ